MEDQNIIIRDLSVEKLEQFQEYCVGKILDGSFKIKKNRYFNNVDRGRTELYSGIYEMKLVEVKEVSNIRQLNIDDIVSISVVSCHESFHIIEDTYKNSKDEDKRNIFIDKMANELWEGLKGVNYPNQIYEIEARKQSYLKATEMIVDYFKLDEKQEKMIFKKVINPMLKYEEPGYEGKMLEKLEIKDMNRALEVVEEYYERKITREKEKLYDYPDNKFNGKYEKLKNKSYSNRIDQCLDIIKISLEPGNKLLGNPETKEIIKESFIMELIKEPSISGLRQKA